MQALLAGIQLKPPRLRIRIAGTNGKGSTAFMLSAALSACGMRVGLYSSPHIHHFNERIRINGCPIDQNELLAALEHLVPPALRIGASYFELATALALRYFTAKNVEVEILEAGVGARLDATTAVPADMALITPIGLDHQAWLGHSLGAIAAEKAYVTCGCQWTISAPQHPVVARVLKGFRPDIQIQGHTPLVPAIASPGRHQQINASLALAAMQQLRANVFPEIDMIAVRKVISETIIEGRMQPVRRGKQLIWLDAAHNSHAIEAIIPALMELADPFDAIFIFPRRDRDLSNSLAPLRACSRRLVTPAWMQPDSDFSYANLEDAMREELGRLQDGRFLVLGSFHAVSAAANWLSNENPGQEGITTNFTDTHQNDKTDQRTAQQSGGQAKRVTDDR